MFRKEGDEYFQFEGSGMVGKSSYTKRSLLKGEGEQAQDIINTMLRKFISIREPGHEYYYHMFLSGVLSITSGDDLVVKSQIEQGDGNPDIIIDNRSSREAVILELKKADGKDISKLKNAAETSLEQIRKNNYDRDLKERNYRKIVNYGISFYGKECLVIKMPDETASS